MKQIDFILRWWDTAASIMFVMLIIIIIMGWAGGLMEWAGEQGMSTDPTLWMVFCAFSAIILPIAKRVMNGTIS